MAKKEEYFCLFGPCFQQREAEMQVIISSSRKLKLKPSKNDSKISLKQSNNSTIHSEINSKHQRSAFRQNTRKIEEEIKVLKENRFSTTNRPFNSPSSTNKPEIMAFNGKLLQSALNHEFVKSIPSVHVRFEENSLQKTTKLFPQNSKQSLKSSNLKQLELQETKILRPELLTKLDSYKQSVVSIMNQNEFIHQKLEESMILIDYFHPTEDQAFEYQKFLMHRQ